MRVIGAKKVTIDMDDRTAKLLFDTNYEENERVVHEYIHEEYKWQLLERKETRRHSSIENLSEMGVDFISTDDIESAVFKNLDIQIVRNAMSQLLPVQQELIQKVYFEEIKISEIAKTYGISHQAVSNRIKNILIKIKKLLK